MVTLTEKPATATPAPAPRSSRRGLLPYAYVSPTVVLIVGLMVIPIIMVVSYSLQDNAIVGKNPVFIGFANYTRVLTDPDFLTALGNTLFFIVVSTVAHLILGLTFALMLNSRMLGSFTRSVFRVVYILPWLFTIAIVAVVWRLMLDPYGVMNYLLKTFGLIKQEVDWFGDPNIARWALTGVNIWSGYPFFMISILAGLQGIPPDLYEAASVDGAGGVKQFRYITIPQLRPVLISMAVLDLIWTSQQFALIWMTTGGGPLNATEMVSTYTYKQAFSSYDFSTASAAAVIILLLTMILAVFYVRSQRDR